MLNEVDREFEIKERASEREVMKTEPMENQKKITTTNRGENRNQRGRYHTQGKVCRRCGKSNHLSFECRSPLRICYNCKELMSNHTAETCFKPVGYRHNRRVDIRWVDLLVLQEDYERELVIHIVKIVSDN